MVSNGRGRGGPLFFKTVMAGEGEERRVHLLHITGRHLHVLTTTDFLYFIFYVVQARENSTTTGWKAEIRRFRGTLASRTRRARSVGRTAVGNSGGGDGGSDDRARLASATTATAVYIPSSRQQLSVAAGCGRPRAPVTSG